MGLALSESDQSLVRARTAVGPLLVHTVGQGQKSRRLFRNRLGHKAQGVSSKGYPETAVVMADMVCSLISDPTARVMCFNRDL